MKLSTRIGIAILGVFYILFTYVVFFVKDEWLTTLWLLITSYAIFIVLIKYSENTEETVWEKLIKWIDSKDA